LIRLQIFGLTASGLWIAVEIGLSSA